MSFVWAGRTGQPPPPPDPDAGPPLWRVILRPRAVLRRRLRGLADDLQRVAVEVGAQERQHGGDTPLGYRLATIATELEELSRGQTELG